MTETSPQATFGGPSQHLDQLDRSEQYRLRATQGRPIPGIRLRVVDIETSEPVPWDERTPGEVQVRGPWVTASYYRQEGESSSFADGWLRTGDVAVITSSGEIKLVDRLKDLVKSGGEWISSLELETSLMAHPAVREAAVIGISHERWGERPIGFVALNPGHEVTADGLRQHLAERVPKWWIPDDFVFVAEIPKTSVGKFDKRSLRVSLAHGPSEISHASKR